MYLILAVLNFVTGLINMIEAIMKNKVAALLIGELSLAAGVVCCLGLRVLEAIQEKARQ